MDFTSVSTDALLKELSSRCRLGVVSAIANDGSRADVWWGDRLRCIGLVYRVTHAIQGELDELEDYEDQDPDEETEEETTLRDMPHFGTYI